MSSTLISILAIGFLIFVHELGHFLACRATKTRVETFSIGFGPRLFGWERPKGGRARFTLGRRRISPADHAMDVRIAAVPLGGYVKMAGEIGGDGSAGDARDGGGRPHAADEFPAKPFWARVLIITAGVAMNAVSAFAFLSIAYGIGLTEPDAIVGGVAPGGPAWKAGIEPGDRIVAIDGTPMRSFLDVRLEAPLLRKGRPVPVEVERDGRRRTVEVRPVAGGEAGLLQMQIGPGAVWTAGEGEERLVVGPQDRVAVGNRVVVGGDDAQEAAEEALTLGVEPVVVERLDGSGRKTPVRPGKAPDGTRIGVAAHVTTTIETVRAGSAAEAAGLAPGDRLVSADGTALDVLARLRHLAAIERVEVRRGEETRTVAVGAADREAVAAFLDGIAFDVSDRVRVDPHARGYRDGRGPAAEAGVRPGDEVVAVNGEAVSTFEELLRAVHGAGAKEMTLRVRTGDEAPRDVRLTPRALDFGVGTLEVARTSIGGTGVGDALALGARRTLREFTNLFRMLRSFFTGEIRVDKGVGGPVTLVAMSSESLTQGFSVFLLLLAVISVNLAVLNILPIPVLDGGQLLFLLIEKVRGKPLKESTVAKAQLVGLFLLLGLMAFALRNDFRLLSSR